MIGDKVGPVIVHTAVVGISFPRRPEEVEFKFLLLFDEGAGVAGPAGLGGGVESVGRLVTGWGQGLLLTRDRPRSR